MTLEQRDGTISMAHRGCDVKRLRYARNLVSWSVDDGNAGNGSIYFFRSRSAPVEPATNRFFGKIWDADQAPPVRSNWLGCVAFLSNPHAAAQDAELEYAATVTGINLALGVAALRLWKDGTDRIGARGLVPVANAERPVSDSKAVSRSRGSTTGTFQADP